MTKKINSLKDLGSLTFFEKTESILEEDNNSEDILNKKNQLLEAHFSNKGRSGKVVTVIKGFVGSEHSLKTLASLLKTKCSVGGSVKDGEIIIQGNIREKIIKFLLDEGYKVKRVGG